MWGLFACKDSIWQGECQIYLRAAGTCGNFAAYRFRPV